MSQTHLTGLGNLSAANQPRIRDGVARRAEGTGGNEGAFTREPHDAVYLLKDFLGLDDGLSPKTL